MQWLKRRGKLNKFSTIQWMSILCQLMVRIKKTNIKYLILKSFWLCFIGSFWFIYSTVKYSFFFFLNWYIYFNINGKLIYMYKQENRSFKQLVSPHGPQTHHFKLHIALHSLFIRRLTFHKPHRNMSTT